MHANINKAYGEPGDDFWAYDVIDVRDAKIVLEGLAEKRGERYHLSIGPNREGLNEVGNARDPHDADKMLVGILQARADTL